MGSHVSKDVSTDQTNFPKNSNNEIKYFGLTISSLGNNINDSSNYNGIINDNSLLSNKSNNYFNDKLTKDKNISESNSNNLINFIWKEGGDEVFITGSFCDWKKRFKMNKNENNIFEKEILLLKGIYEFKFIVDGVWKCSSYYPHKSDKEGNDNNYIDNTIIKINNNLDITNLKNNALNENISTNLQDLKKKYNNIYPYKHQLNIEAPKTPDVFEILMDLNDKSNQNYFGNNQYLKFPFVNLDKSYKRILHPFHSYLNHLFIYNDMQLIESTDKK